MGVFLAVVAFGIWGLAPLFWKLLQEVPAYEILMHRVVWGFVMMFLLIGIQRRWDEVKQLLTHKKSLLTLIATSILISTNWYAFVYAVNNNQVMQASLGYFLNPLLNVGLGMIFLNERFDFFQGCALALAGIGVGVLVGFYGEIPVLALFLAVTFAFYGLLRKVINCNPVIGLFIEMLFVLPFGLIYAYYLNQRGDLVFGLPFDHLDFHLFLTGIITVFPLAIFAAAVKRLSFIAVGLLQYIAPTGQFLLAVIVFKEEFTVAHKITFTLIWLGLILYSYRNFTNQRALARILKEQRATN